MYNNNYCYEAWLPKTLYMLILGQMKMKIDQGKKKKTKPVTSCVTDTDHPYFFPVIFATTCSKVDNT